MKIALAQIDCRLGNIPANAATHQGALIAAQEQYADFVVFPELSLTGYRLRSNIHRVMLDDDELDAQWAAIAPIYKVDNEIYCLLGYVELTRRAALHNTMALLRAGEDPLFRHRKVYLPSYGMFEEERYMRPGDRFRVIDITTRAGENWRVGVLCCEDAWHSSAWTIMQARGVDLVVVPSASPGRGVESERLGSQRSWYGILGTHAEQAGCWVAYCNRVGFEDDIHFWGGSALFAPTGEIVQQSPLLEPDMLVAEIDKRAITTARLLTPLSASEDWALTIRELQGAYGEKIEE